MGLELKKCKRQVNIVTRSQDKLKQQVNRHKNLLTKMQVEILKAAGSQEDARAKELIRKRKRFEQTLHQLERQLNKHKSVADTTQETVRKIELKIEEARRKKLLLATQRQAYETSKRLTDGLHGSSGNLLEEIDDDVTFLQTETRLALDIDVDRIGLDDFDARLEEHEEEFSKSNYITEDEELAQLKSRIDENKEGEEVLLDESEDKPREAKPREQASPQTEPEQEPESPAPEAEKEPETPAPEAEKEPESLAPEAEKEPETPEPVGEEETSEDEELAALKQQLAQKGGAIIEAAQKAAEEAQAKVDAETPSSLPKNESTESKAHREKKKAPARVDLLIIDDDEEEEDPAKKAKAEAEDEGIIFIDDD